MACWCTVTFRWQVMTCQLVTVTVLGYLDSWVSDLGPRALVLAALVLAPGLVWSSAAPSARAAWWTAIADTAALVGCILLSRALSHGPAAPIIDWFAAYAALNIIVHLIAVLATRAVKRFVWLSLLPILLVTPCWAFVTVASEGEGGQGASPRSVQPLTSAWLVTQIHGEECGQDGGVCDSTIKVANTTPDKVEAQLHHAGWTSWCQPNTGLLSSLGFLDYGRTCITITATKDNAVRIEIVGYATWWCHIQDDLPGPTVRSPCSAPVAMRIRHQRGTRAPPWVRAVDLGPAAGVVGLLIWFRRSWASTVQAGAL